MQNNGKRHQQHRHLSERQRKIKAMKERKKREMKRNIILALIGVGLIVITTVVVLFFQIPDKGDLSQRIQKDQNEAYVKITSIYIAPSTEQDVYYENDTIDLTAFVTYTNAANETKTYKTNQDLKVKMVLGDSICQVKNSQIFIKGSNEKDEEIKARIYFYKSFYSFSTDVIGVPHATSSKNTDTSSIKLLVNSKNTLSKDFVPDDLVYMENVDCVYGPKGDTSRLKKEVAQAYQKMYDAAKKDGITLFLKDGYMDYPTCEGLYLTQKELKEDNRSVINLDKQGENEHQSGLAVDITSSETAYTTLPSFANTKEYKWLSKNAAKYGFILRYPKGKETETGHSFDPCHYRYIGSDAEQIEKAKISLEYYFNK